MQEKTKASKQEAKSPSADPNTFPEDQFPLAVLRENANFLFGVGAHIVDGALYGQQRKEFYTKDEIKQRIDIFMKQEVK